MSNFSLKSEYLQQIMMVLRDVVKAENTDEDLRYRADQYWRMLMLLLDVDESFEATDVS